MTVHHQCIVVRQFRTRFLTSHFPLKSSLRGVVLEQVSKIVRGDYVVYRDNVNLLPEQALLNDSTKYQTPDPPDPVNSNFGPDGWSLNKVRRQLSGHRENVN